MSPILLIAALLATPAPTSGELLKALSDWDRAAVPTEVRSIRCDFFEEEPTEATCHWRQRTGKGRWVRASTIMAIDGDGWSLIDGVTLKLQPKTATLPR